MDFTSVLWVSACVTIMYVWITVPKGLGERLKSLETQQAAQSNSLDRTDRRIDQAVVQTNENTKAHDAALKELKRRVDEIEDEDDITGLVDDQEPLLTDAQRVQAHFDVSQAATMSELITRLKGVMQ